MHIPFHIFRINADVLWRSENTATGQQVPGVDLSLLSASCILLHRQCVAWLHGYGK
jgi:hypothetical protein